MNTRLRSKKAFTDNLVPLKHGPKKVQVSLDHTEVLKNLSLIAIEINRECSGNSHPSSVIYMKYKLD